MSDETKPVPKPAPKAAAKPAEDEYEIRDLNDVHGGEWESIGGGKVRRLKPKPAEGEAKAKS